MTGVAQFFIELGSKRWQLLYELVPSANIFGLLVNPKNPTAETQVTDASEVARATGMQLIVVTAGSEAELDTAFASLIQQRAAGLIVGADPATYSWRERLLGAGGTRRSFDRASWTARWRL